jgi:hypothetical protein
MRKTIATFTLLAILLAIAPLAAEAQNRCRKNRKYYNRSYTSRTYYSPQRPSFYQRHRNLINIGAGTGAGALLGGILGGKKGALTGALIGAGSSAVYSYYINKKKRRFR